MVSTSSAFGIKLQSFLNDSKLWRPILPTTGRTFELRKLLHGRHQILEECRPLIDVWMRMHGIECFKVTIQRSAAKPSSSLLEIRIPENEFRRNLSRIDSVAQQTLSLPSQERPDFEDWLLCTNPTENESNSEDSWDKCSQRSS